MQTQTLQASGLHTMLQAKQWFSRLSLIIDTGSIGHQISVKFKFSAIEIPSHFSVANSVALTL